MLLELEIENFAIIKEQRITFGPGLNVISGETGAGKSIVLEALKLLLGAKSSSDLIRTGESNLTVRGLFEWREVQAIEDIPDILLTPERDRVASDEVLLTRELTSAGRNRVYVNGRLGSVGMLQDISKQLISICGQNENLALLDGKFHLEAVDRFCGHDALVDTYQKSYEAWKESSAKLKELRAQSEGAAARNVRYQEIIGDLEPLKLIPGIRKGLEEEIRELGGGEKLKLGLTSVQELLSDESNSHFLSSVRSELKNLLKVSSKISPMLEQLETAQSLLADFEGQIGRFADGLILDEERIQAVRDELAEVARLERKYRTDDSGLIALLNEARSALEKEDLENALLQAEKAETIARSDLLSGASKLSKAREKGAKKLVKLVEQELSELAMTGARLNVLIEPTEPSRTGIDKLEFLISPNKGEELKPLRQIASGGELSRIMLVLNKVLRERAGLYVLVFDEVDSGISGGVARAVGEKLKQLAENSQVICITHLPQVASLADRHILVQKQVGARTETLIKVLKEEEKVEEIARMLAGHKVTESARRSAQELMQYKRLGKS